MSAYLVFEGGSAGIGLTGEANVVAIGSAASSIAVVFTTSFGSTNYAILYTFTNLTDPTPIFLQAITTAKSATGFTATFNAPTDTANYVLEYVIVGHP